MNLVVGHGGSRLQLTYQLVVLSLGSLVVLIIVVGAYRMIVVAAIIIIRWRR